MTGQWLFEETPLYFRHVLGGTRNPCNIFDQHKHLSFGNSFRIPLGLYVKQKHGSTLKRMSEKHVSKENSNNPLEHTSDPQLAILSYLYFEVPGVSSGDLLEFVESEILWNHKNHPSDGPLHGIRRIRTSHPEKKHELMDDALHFIALYDTDNSPKNS